MKAEIESGHREYQQKLTQMQRQQTDRVEALQTKIGLMTKEMAIFKKSIAKKKFVITKKSNLKQVDIADNKDKRNGFESIFKWNLISSM